jgi:hypothetical protein
VEYRRFDRAEEDLNLDTIDACIPLSAELGINDMSRGMGK